MPGLVNYSAILVGTLRSMGRWRTLREDQFLDDAETRVFPGTVLWRRKRLSRFLVLRSTLVFVSLPEWIAPSRGRGAAAPNGLTLFNVSSG